MYPFQDKIDLDDLAELYAKAVSDLSEGENLRKSLLLINGVPSEQTQIGRMLFDPKENYETVGFVVTDTDDDGNPDDCQVGDIEERLLNARNTFAYAIYLGYPSDNILQTQAYLLDSIKSISNTFLMVADEFLIDSLEFRFSSETIGLEQKLDEQITMLTKAQLCYSKSVASFMFAFSPAPGTNVYASNYFDDGTYSLFHLSVERQSSALREKSSKQLVRQMTPGSNYQWDNAYDAALDTLKDVYTTTYITTAAIAQKQGESFSDTSADSLTESLNALRKQGNIYNSRLNPLGYDNRYIPMNDFDKLYNVALTDIQYAKEQKTAFDQEKREFDFDIDKLKNEVEQLNIHYAETLFSLTGCASPPPGTLPDDPAVQEFIICTGEAGGDLFDCSLDSTPDEFDSCVSGQKTKGVLAAKYRNTMDAQLRLKLARLQRENILERINLENEKKDKLIEIKRSAADAQKVLLDKYYKKLKEARTETNTVTKAIVHEWDSENKEWIKLDKPRDYTTTETFYIKNETLQLDTKKEKKLLAITTDFEIKQVDLDTAYNIKNW